MRYLPFLTAVTLFLPGISAAQQLVINEVDADQPGSDRAEFVELFDGGTGGTSLDGLVLVFFNGSNDTSYRAVDLSGETTTERGYFVVGNPGVANVGIEIDPGSSGAIQNGPDAVALFNGSAADFPNSTPVTNIGLIDAIVYGTEDPDAFNLLDVLTPGQEQLNDTPAEAMARVPDGGTARDTSSYILQEPSPGTPNKVDDSLQLTLELSADTIAENSGGTITATVARTGGAASEVTVSIGIDDRSELSADASLALGIDEVSKSFELSPIDDAWPDGAQTVTVTVKAEDNSLNPAAKTVTVTDDNDPDGIVVNEVYPAVANFSGDANGDGEILDSLDEFVELVNHSGSRFDLSGFTLSDSLTVRHIFPENSVLEPGCALVVFGGGNINEGLLEEFNGALVQKGNGPGEANAFGLGLNNSGDLVSVKNLDGVEVAGFSWDAVSASDGSLTRAPDITGAYDFHAFVGTQEDFSPGSTIDQDAFCEVTLALDVRFSVAGINENAGAGAATLTITRSGPTDESLVVKLSNGDPSEISIPTEATIVAGQPSLTVQVDAVNDEALDEGQVVTVTASAPGYVIGTATIVVNDDGDAPVAVVINEFDADQPGEDDQEFIELYDGGAGNLPLDGLIVVLFNGSNDSSYDTIDLNGQSTDNDGFFVLGAESVPGVDLAVAGFQLQNGPDGIAVYRDAAEFFPNNTPPADENLIDAIVYGTSDPDAVGLLDVLTPGAAQADEGVSNNVDALARIPDGGPPFDSSRFVAQAPTPGASNSSGGEPGGYLLWQQAFPGIGGPGDDHEKDTLTNLMEYALGLDPTVDDAGQVPSPSLNGAGQLEFSVTKGEIAGADPRLAYSLEISTDLVNWTRDGVDIREDSASSLVAVFASDTSSIFTRLAASLQP